MSVTILKKRDPQAVETERESTPSSAVAAAQAKVNTAQAPSQYTSVWQQELADTMKKIQNREPFSYNINGDALYDQYKQKYTAQGKQAMDDTVGKVASMTGGYGSSYAVTAGQQAYNEHLGKLNDIIPELYQMAYDRYNDEGDALLKQYSMLSEREAEDYARWRDTVADQRYADELQYQKDRDTVADTRYADEWQYQKDRDTAQDRLDYAIALLKNGGETGDTGNKPYGEYTAGEFIEKLSELAADYSESVEFGGDGTIAVRTAAALTKAVGTEEAMNAFREIFGDDVYQEAMVYTDRMREFEAGLKTESELDRRGINYDKYYIESVLTALDNGKLDSEEAATLLDEHGLIERFNNEYSK